MPETSFAHSLRRSSSCLKYNEYGADVYVFLSTMRPLSACLTHLTVAHARGLRGRSVSICMTEAHNLAVVIFTLQQSQVIAIRALRKHRRLRSSHSSGIPTSTSSDGNFTAKNMTRMHGHDTSRVAASRAPLLLLLRCSPCGFEL